MSNPLSAGVRFLIDGCVPTPKEIYNARLKTCEACPKWRPHILGGSCGKCACITVIKLRLPKESCPIGKWKAL